MERWRRPGTRSAKGAAREQLHLPPLVPGGVPKRVATLGGLWESVALSALRGRGLRVPGVPTAGPCPRCLNGSCGAAIPGSRERGLLHPGLARTPQRAAPDPAALQRKASTAIVPAPPRATCPAARRPLLTFSCARLRRFCTFLAKMPVLMSAMAAAVRRAGRAERAASRQRRGGAQEEEEEEREEEQLKREEPRRQRVREGRGDRTGLKR